MLSWTDTHAHIYAEEFAKDQAEVLQRGQEQGINRIFMPNVDHTSIDGMLDLESRHPHCVAMMGLHPCSVKKDFERELYQVESWLQKRSFAAIGEMGTDLYWDKTFWPQQQEAFRIQAQWAKQYNLPMILHCRESVNETLELLKPFADGKLTGIFHCFSGTLEQARQAIEMNFFLGIGGVATFKNGGLEPVLREIPLDRLVLETDSPYLAPVPHRGKRNEPAFIPLIARKICDIRQISLEELSLATEANASRIFNPTTR